MQLTQNQSLFCAEYLKSGNVFQAASSASIGLLTVIPKGFYVYFLIELETGQIFYVGKGTGRRAKAHFDKGDTCNLEKSARITQIRRVGNTPSWVIFASGLSNDDALSIERHMIAAIEEGLTNYSPGCRTEMERALFKVQQSLDSVIPFDLWIALAPRSERQIKNYWFIVNSYKELISLNNG